MDDPSSYIYRIGNEGDCNQSIKIVNVQIINQLTSRQVCQRCLAAQGAESNPSGLIAVEELPLSMSLMVYANVIDA
jgi:hypothetical protein